MRIVARAMPMHGEDTEQELHVTTGGRPVLEPPGGLNLRPRMEGLGGFNPKQAVEMFVETQYYA